MVEGLFLGLFYFFSVGKIKPAEKIRGELFFQKHAQNLSLEGKETCLK